MSNGKIAFKSNSNFGLWNCYKGCDHEETGDDYEAYGDIYTKRCVKPNFSKIKSKSTEVQGITWKIVGLIKDENALLTDDKGEHQIWGHTLKLSLAASGIADGQECDVSGRFTVSTELNGKELVTLLFSRTFSSTNPDFLGDTEEIDVFEDLEIKSKDDRVIVKVEFTVEPLRKVIKWARNDSITVTVTVNEQDVKEIVKVNKNLLALHSEHFSTLKNIILPPPTTVDDFKLLLDILDGKRALDDECIENIFLLANIFAFEELEAKCRTFLIEESEKSAFFKYRLADKFGLIILRAFILKNMTEKDVDENGQFLNNPDYEELDETSKAVILDRKAEIYEDNMEEEESTTIESEISDESDEEMEEENDN